MDVRQYAKYMGSLIVLIGVVGLVLALMGQRTLLGLLNVEIVEDIVHLATGGLMAYAGFAGTRALARSVVGGLGVVYLLVGVLGLILPTLFGLLPSGLTMLDNLIHLVLGVLGVAVAWVMGRGTADADVVSAPAA